MKDKLLIKMLETNKDKILKLKEELKEKSKKIHIRKKLLFNNGVEPKAIIKNDLIVALNNEIRLIHKKIKAKENRIKRLTLRLEL